MSCFDGLPAEIRISIWELCLPDPETPEVYFYDRSEISESDPDWAADLEVLTGFPSIMHLCSESREFAKTRLSFWEGQPVAGGPPVSLPCRPYRPATDVCFVPDLEEFSAHVVEAQSARYNQLQNGVVPAEGVGAKTVFSEHIGHLAFDAEENPEYVVVGMTALRTLSLVFYRVGKRTAIAPGADTAARRCMLVPFTEKMGETRSADVEDGEEVEIDDFLGGMEMESSLWELDDKDRAPWNPETGEWLFEFKAVELVHAPCNLY